MKKALVITALILTQITAHAAEKTPTLAEQIAADAARDPYAETQKQPLRYELEETTIIEGYQPPAAAEFMQPSKVFKVQNGNIVVKQPAK